MATYFVGDIQGCFDELQALLAKVAFNPSRDELWVVGDMVARGTQSLETLRYLKGLEGSVKPVLGNHDLHLMALYGKVKRVNPKDNLDALLDAPDLNQLIDWLRLQPLAREHKSHSILMAHAGIPPQWDAETALKASYEVQQALAEDGYIEHLIAKMYTNSVSEWSPETQGLERLVYTINALTRMRFLYSNGRLDFDCKLPPANGEKEGLIPWFKQPGRAMKHHTLVFGHWAALMGEVDQPGLQALDTGCCWGHYLTLWHLESNQKITQNKLKKS
ncbi:symmetrical bis(5'-nucleosyl)-tetraphosphatase [Shewanella sp. Isolate7]|uniref:symmetrical bis(5'-nucleosyl)-tetraphosphatase n=1 Tax=Shewanella sp. Isolate7 TaxID=2908528 RepID=UPI001EFD7838|nr:symmetrical bis(5'-nucleosyl)-tetraphosphatase [Shewanella sp. Isolate7]MCG9721293.1 symmetrical bis(5'-nucleosyl)-tetraphosphatase [Shewanella sp. Isolate7]